MLLSALRLINQSGLVDTHPRQLELCETVHRFAEQEPSNWFQFVREVDLEVLSPLLQLLNEDNHRITW